MIWNSSHVLRSLLVLLFALSLMSYVYIYDGKLTGTSWSLNCIIFGQDTLFYRNDSTYTYTYNLKQLDKNKLDQASINELNAKIFNSFHSMLRMKINFQSDSTCIMTKMRSGGRIFINELDSGIYSLKNDSLEMTLHTRRNYVIRLQLDKNAKKLTMSGVGPLDKVVYSEFVLD